MKTFLKPLTPEEERHYLQEYKQGSLEAKNILIERNLRLVAHIVKKYQGASEDDKLYFGRTEDGILQKTDRILYAA